MANRNNYIGFRLRIGEAGELIRYLTREQERGVLKANYITSTPEHSNNLACFNIEVIVKESFGEVIRSLKQIIPDFNFQS